MLVSFDLVRFPDPLADGSDFFKVRRGPCPVSTPWLAASRDEDLWRKQIISIERECPQVLVHAHKEQLVVSPNRRAELCSGAPSREQTSKARTYEQIRAHKSKHVSEWPGDQVRREDIWEGFGLFFAWVGKEGFSLRLRAGGWIFRHIFGSLGPFSGVQLSWSLLLAVTFLVCDELWVCELMRVGGQRLYAGRQTLQEVFSHCCEARLTQFLSKFGELSIWD